MPCSTGPHHVSRFPCTQFTHCSISSCAQGFLAVPSRYFGILWWFHYNPEFPEARLPPKSTPIGSSRVLGPPSNLWVERLLTSGKEKKINLNSKEITYFYQPLKEFNIFLVMNVGKRQQHFVWFCHPQLRQMFSHLITGVQVSWDAVYHYPRNC